MKRPLQIIYRPLLTQGMFCVGKTPLDGYMILIDSGQSREQMAVSLWHEIIHLLDNAAGRENNEEAVEKLAAKWAKKCPEILEICKAP